MKKIYADKRQIPGDVVNYKYKIALQLEGNQCELLTEVYGATTTTYINSGSFQIMGNLYQVPEDIRDGIKSMLKSGDNNSADYAFTVLEKYFKEL